MLTIRDQQINYLDATVQSPLVIAAIHYLKDKHPDYVIGLSEKNLEKFVRIGLYYAVQNEFTSEYGAILFVTCMFVAAPNFFEYQKVRKIFQNGKSDRERIEEMEATLTDEDWINIQKSYNEHFWDV